MPSNFTGTIGEQWHNFSGIVGTPPLLPYNGYYLSGTSETAPAIFGRNKLPGPRVE